MVQLQHLEIRSNTCTCISLRNMVPIMHQLRELTIYSSAQIYDKEALLDMFASGINLEFLYVNQGDYPIHNKDDILELVSTFKSILLNVIRTA